METEPAKANESNATGNPALKYGLIAVIVLLVVYYLFSYLPKQRDLGVRQECSDESVKMMQEYQQAEYKNVNQDLLKPERIFLMPGYKTAYENCLSRKSLKP